MKESKCNRVGKCCQGLFTRNSKYLYELHYADTSVDIRNRAILRLWYSVAKQTKSSKFRCPLLTGTNICRVQNNKPPLCSYSLSPDALEGKESDLPFAFFHPSCGYLEGAPSYFKKLVVMRNRDLERPLEGAELEEYQRLCNRAMSEGWRIQNGNWIQKTKGNEK